ncbi:MAG: DNA metabolism protein, partial [Prevotella sp.]|nr:DNA metabolism protein [Prevotella sp.]
MLVYTFDRTLDGVLSAVFDAFFRHQLPDVLLGNGEQLPLFSEDVYCVVTTEEKVTRVWAGLEKLLSKEAMRLLLISWQSENPALSTPLFN